MEIRKLRASYYIRSLIDIRLEDDYLLLPHHLGDLLFAHKIDTVEGFLDVLRNNRPLLVQGLGWNTQDFMDCLEALDLALRVNPPAVP